MNNQKKLDKILTLKVIAFDGSGSSNRRDNRDRRSPPSFTRFSLLKDSSALTGFTHAADIRVKAFFILISMSSVLTPCKNVNIRRHANPIWILITPETPTPQRTEYMSNSFNRKHDNKRHDLMYYHVWKNWIC